MSIITKLEIPHKYSLTCNDFEYLKKERMLQVTFAQQEKYALRNLTTLWKVDFSQSNPHNITRLKVANAPFF